MRFKKVNWQRPNCPGYPDHLADEHRQAGHAQRIDGQGGGVLYLAASHTSVHTLVHAFNELFIGSRAMRVAPWTLRATPPCCSVCTGEHAASSSSPVALRKAEQPVAVGGAEASIGDRVVIDLQTANRDTGVFGDDAGAFNPFRDRPPRISPAGLSFGGGTHVCLGMNLVAGTILNPQAIDPDNHQFGTIALILAELLVAVPNPIPSDQQKKSPHRNGTCGPAIRSSSPRIPETCAGPDPGDGL